MGQSTHLRLRRSLSEREPEDAVTSPADFAPDNAPAEPIAGGVSSRFDYDLGHIPINPGGESRENSFIQRQTETLTKPIGPEGGMLDDATSGRIEAARAQGGAPLGGIARTEMEPLFHYDFSQVRIFADSEADALNRDLSASAFTTGSDIFFRDGSYNPSTQQGQALLAHELTHVVQQDGVSSGTPHIVGPVDGAHEHAANRAAEGTMSAPERQPSIPLSNDPGVASAAATTLHRQPLPATEEKKTTPNQSSENADPSVFPGQMPGQKPESNAAGNQQNQFPAWSDYVPPMLARTPVQIPGDLPPGYEQPRLGYSEADIRDLMLATDERDSQNKQNAGQFIADYGATLLSIWSDYVMDAVEKAGKAAEWSLFGDVLGFVARKGLEVLSVELFMADVAGSAFMKFLEELSKKAEGVVEKGVENLSGFGLEKQQESLKEHEGESEVDREKEKLRHVTRTLSTNFSHLAFETIRDLPSPGPYYYWLSAIRENHDYDSLASYRIPPLFPEVSETVIETSIAGSIVNQLWRLDRSEPGMGSADYSNSADRVRPGDDNIVAVDGPGLDRATMRISSPALKEALAGKKIHDLPMIPLHIGISGVMNMETAASKLVAAYRGMAPTDSTEIFQFMAAFGKEAVEPVDLMRNADGEFFALSPQGHVLGAASPDSKTDFTFPAKLYLYQWGASDWDLTQLTDYILSQAPVSIDAHEMGMSEMVPTDTLAQLTREYFESATMSELVDKGSKNMLKNHIEELVPTER